jgi:DNA-binding CsgD family transcriptional regulator
MLFGRERELVEVGEALEERIPILLTGEAGIGKSALMRAAAGQRKEGMLVGGGLATLAWMSYLPVTRALRREPPAGDHATVAAVVRNAVRGQVLILDDLQWADSETLALLPFLAGRVRLLAAVRRGDPAAERVRTGAERAGFREMELDALPEEDAFALVQARRPDLDAGAAQMIVERACGNALLLEELSAGSASPDRLRLALSARLQPHSEAALATVRRLALLGRPAGRELAGQELDELEEAGLVVATNGQIELRHALLGETALEGLDATERRRLHAEIARSVPDPGEAARHHAAGGERGRACVKALEAAELAVRPGERARHLALAARTAPDARADELRLQAAAALLDAGDFEAARELADAVESDDTEDRAHAALLGGRARWYLGAPKEALRYLESGSELVAKAGTQLEAGLLRERARVLIWEWDREGALVLARKAWEITREAGAPQTSVRLVLGAACYAAGSADCLDHVRASLEEARRTGDGALECEATAALVACLQAFGDSTAAYRLACSAIGRGVALGLANREAEFRYLRAHLEIERGEYGRAIRELSELLDDPVSLGQHVGRARARLAVSYADTGRIAEACELLQTALAGASNADEREALLYARAEVEWLAGRPSRALAAIDACLQENPRTFHAADLEVIRGWALLDLGRRKRPAVHSSPYPVVAGALSEARAIWLLAGADTAPEAQRVFERAAYQWHGETLRSETRCMWGAGEAARRSGDLESARRLLLAVEEGAAAHGLLPLLARIRRSLRGAGVHRAAPRAKRDGVLTAREQEVLELVAEGLSSAEIAARLGVARSTVESQVRSARTKLQAKTRLEAALLAAGLPAD